MCVHRLTDASPMPIDAPELESWTFFIIKWWLLDFDFELDLNLEFLAFHGAVLCRPAGVYVHGDYWSTHKYFSLFNTGRARVVQVEEEEEQEEAAPAEGRRRRPPPSQTLTGLQHKQTCRQQTEETSRQTNRKTAAGKQDSVWPDMTNGRMVKSSYCHVM